MNNNKEIVVKVIDRGPFRKKRIVDLSYAAAKELEMLRQGVVKVEVMVYQDTIFQTNVIDTLNLTVLN